MATNKGNSKNKNSKKYAAAQKEKLTAGDFFGGFGKWEMLSFGIGFLIVVCSIFLLVAFVSYLFTGEADFSLLEQTSDPLNKSLQYRNVCGALYLFLRK